MKAWRAVIDGIGKSKEPWVLATTTGDAKVTPPSADFSRMICLVPSAG